MEYSEAVGIIKKCSGRCEEEVENLLGYLFYEEDGVEEIMPMEQDDLVNALSTAEKISFGLQEGATLGESAALAAKEANLGDFSDISTLLVRFIGGEGLDEDDAIRAFSSIEGAMGNNFPADVLLGLTIDPSIGDQKITALLAVESEEE